MHEFGVIRSPREIVFGVGTREYLPVAVARYGTKALICTDPFIATTPQFLHAVASMKTRDIAVHVISYVAPELPLDNVRHALADAEAFGPDVIVGYGGGSAMDMAKLVSLGLRYGAGYPTFYGENSVPGEVIPVIAVPTTAGTGSEVTPVAVLADSERELKVGVSSPYLVPSVAIVDPELTFTCPPSVSAYSGIDAFAHAVESFSASDKDIGWNDVPPVFVGKNVLSSGFALDAIRLINGSLTQVVVQPEDHGARERMARGSLLAGLAFGTGGTHLSHALQYPIGDLTKTPHGLGIGLLLPYVMEACLPFASRSFAEIGEAMEVDGNSEADLAKNAVRRVAELRASISVPETLEAIGVEITDLLRIEKSARTVTRLVANSPSADGESLLKAILERAWHGQSDLFETQTTASREGQKA
jgi:alcohol dehydrogenase class IV